MKTCIIDYESGNLTSVVKATSSVASASMNIIVSNAPKDIIDADYVILPGVGAFGHCRMGLDQIDGLLDAITHHVKVQQRPLLGICVGMQLMADMGFEHGTHQGLGLIAGQVKPLNAVAGLTIPNIGWHPCDFRQDHPLHNGLDQAPWFYFVHSYAYHPASNDDVAATISYGDMITASIAKDNLYGTQFHPEKSQKAGQILLHNFLNWKV
ncbi:MAG: imidazole glycerol phosphate synthase subunit HisH [Alphaproteobacteria bacterium]